MAITGPTVTLSGRLALALEGGAQIDLGEVEIPITVNVGQYLRPPFGHAPGVRSVAEPAEDVMALAVAADVAADPESLVGWTLAGSAYHYATGETLHGVYRDPSNLEDSTLSEEEPDLGRDAPPAHTDGGARLALTGMDRPTVASHIRGAGR